MTRTYRSYKSATPASLQEVSPTVKVIRPEFQLVEVTNLAGFTSQSGRFIPCGTIYGRLYFAEGCEPVGSTIKGQVIYDSRKSAGKGWVERSKGKRYEFHFICPNPNEYARLLNSCATSNMAINRVRTAKLIRELVSNYTNVVQLPVQQPKQQPKQQPVTGATAVAMPNHMVEVPIAAVRTRKEITTIPIKIGKLAEYWETPVIIAPTKVEIKAKPILALPPAKESVSNYSKYSFMLKYKPHTLRVRVCKRFGILTTGISDAHIHEYTINQVAKRNISVQAIKSIFK